MNAPNPGIPQPDLRDLLNSHKDEIFASLNCVRLGTIVSVAGNPPTATVKINSKALVYNTPQAIDDKLEQTPVIVEYPLLTDCPVLTLGGIVNYITIPLAAGDPCVVLFNDRDMDAWFQTGAALPPNSSRMHSLSDGLVIPGFRALTQPLAANGAFLIVHNQSGFDVQINPAIFSSNGGNIQVGSKILISNGSTRLGYAIDNLFTVLNGWINTGGSTPNPATLAALAVSKAEFESLLL